jgi:3-deoxy-manno-octulosonate cytidylyltransferase (CMP-KDO synthetase)
MKTCIIIPARLHSTRLPEKVILLIGDKPMIQLVYEQALKVKGVQKVIIACDHQKVYDTCIGFGAEVMMTSPSHISGTDRIGEVAHKYNNFDCYINIQGDEPMIDADLLSQFNEKLQSNTFDIFTICEKLSSQDDLFDFNVVKVVKSISGKVLYFSRNAIPAFRDKPYKDWFSSQQYYKHIGIYGFQKKALNEITALPVSNLEKTESLEQLRWLDHGYNIGIMESTSFSIGVDTEADLERVRKLMVST